MHRLTSIFLAGLLSAGLAGCTEDLTTPGSCPQTCPGGIAQLLDTVIYAVPDGDSSFVGYQDAGGGSALLVSAGLAAGEFRSAQTVRPYDAFSTLHPVKTRPSSASIAAAAATGSPIASPPRRPRPSCACCGTARW